MRSASYPIPLLRHGFMIYDALFAYLRFAAQERHNWPAKAARGRR
jgi:hypothetical protein